MPSFTIQTYRFKSRRIISIYNIIYTIINLRLSHNNSNNINHYGPTGDATTNNLEDYGALTPN